MAIIGKVSVNKIFAYKYLYASINKNLGAFKRLLVNEGKTRGVVRDYIDILYKKMADQIDAKKVDIKPLDYDLFISKISGYDVVSISIKNTKEIYGVTNIIIVIKGESFRYFLKTNRLAYLSSDYGNLIEIKGEDATEMVDSVNTNSQERIVATVLSYVMKSESIPTIDLNPTMEGMEQILENFKTIVKDPYNNPLVKTDYEKKAKLAEKPVKNKDIESVDPVVKDIAQVFFDNRWIKNTISGYEIFDVCNALDKENKSFYAAYLRNKLFDYRKVEVGKESQVVECERCNIKPCPINVYIQIADFYSGKEYLFFEDKTQDEAMINKAEVGKEQVESEVSEVVSIVEKYDNLTIMVADFLIKNKLVRNLKVDEKDNKVSFEYVDFDELCSSKMEVNPARLIYDAKTSKDVEFKEGKLDLNDLESIEEKYSSLLYDNPYLLAAYIMYLVQDTTVTEKEVYGKIKSLKFDNSCEKDFVTRFMIGKVDNALLDDNSKEELIKMIVYARRRFDNQKLEYIPFNMRLYCNTVEVIDSVIDILQESFEYFKYIKKTDAITKSFYQIDTPAKIDELYDKPGIVVLTDPVALGNLEKLNRDAILNELYDKIAKNTESNLTIIVDKNKVMVDNALESNVTLRDKVFDYELNMKKVTEKDIYNNILEKLEKDYEVTSKFKTKLNGYIKAEYNKTTLSFYEFQDSIYEKIVFNLGFDNKKIDESMVPDYDEDKTTEEIFKELDELVGLDNVKQSLRDLADLLEFKNKTQGKFNLKETNLHMIFLGNPGTGKTTVARMIAGILYNLKYIKYNKMIEVSSKDLVAKYVGQTAPKTNEVIEKALGGVLFIDEAYSLATKDGDSATFNDECIATLIQGMENHRDELVVIFAGYKKEMQDFLDSNSGIVSRIGYTFDFKDYTVDELIGIFKINVSKAKFEITDEAIEKVKEIILEYKDTKNFGNARFVRSLFEKVVVEHAKNIKNETDENKLKTITADDITAENILKM